MKHDTIDTHAATGRMNVNRRGRGEAAFHSKAAKHPYLEVLEVFCFKGLQVLNNSCTINAVSLTPSSLMKPCMMKRLQQALVHARNRK